MVRTAREFEDALHSLGWRLDGPTRTSGGWKATIQRGALSMLETGRTPDQVLEGLLLYAQERARDKQPADAAAGESSL